MALDVDHVRIPDEIKFEMDRVLSRLPTCAEFDDNTKEFKFKRPLKDSENLALTFSSFPKVVDEIIDNINMVMSDLELLGKSSYVFHDNHPFHRYKFLVRMFFY